MTVQFEQLCRVARDQRVRIANLRDSDLDDDDIATLRVEQELYDARLIDLARMLDVPVPQRARRDGQLDADDRFIIEDHLAARGVDLRPA
jgi:hypothetical protein